MGKLQGQAYDTEGFYDKLDREELEKYAVITGFLKDGKNLDASLLLSLVLRNGTRKKITVLEVGCGYGRIGRSFLEREDIDYFGLDLHEPYIASFKEDVGEQDKHRILEGDFLTCVLPFGDADSILFGWSGIGDFDTGGQEAAFKRSHRLLVPEGRIYVDIPKDIMNRFEGYQPGPFNVHEIHDLEKLGLQHVTNHPYQTHTGRNREIIEIKKSCS